MKDLKVKVKTEKIYTFKGLPVTGKGDLLEIPFKGVLRANWQGHIDKVELTNNFDDWGIDDFTSQDKGIPGVYLFDKNGLVFASITHYTGEYGEKDPILSKPHFHVWPANHTGNP